ncbi:MAG: hypothetical protein ACK58U_01970 [Rubrivivax sp.]|jgi:hypothetical protein
MALGDVHGIIAFRVGEDWVTYRVAAAGLLALKALLAPRHAGS